MTCLVKWSDGEVAVMQHSLALELERKRMLKILKVIRKKPLMVKK
jgi:hypothetical protein